MLSQSLGVQPSGVQVGVAAGVGVGAPEDISDADLENDVLAQQMADNILNSEM